MRVQRQLLPTFVYRMFAEDGTLLYVGMTADVRVRMSCHKSASSWFFDTNYIEVESYRSPPAAHAAEIHAITTEHPIHNKRHTPRGAWALVQKKAS